MPNTFKGAIRPKSNPSSKAIEKRVRRKLAHIGAVLHINRPESQALKAHGPCHAVIPATGQVMFEGLTLIGLAQAIGAITPDETPILSGWCVQFENGSMSDPFPTEEEAEQVAELHSDAIGIVRFRLGGAV